MGKHGKRYDDRSNFDLKSRLMSIYPSTAGSIIGIYFAIVSYLLYRSIFGTVIFLSLACMLAWDSIERYINDSIELEDGDYNINEVMPEFSYIAASTFLDLIILIFFIVQFVRDFSNIYIDHAYIIHMIVLVDLFIILAFIFITNLVSMIQYDMIYDDREWEEVCYGTDEEESIKGTSEDQEGDESCARSKRDCHCKSCSCSGVPDSMDYHSDDK